MTNTYVRWTLDEQEVISVEKVFVAPRYRLYTVESEYGQRWCWFWLLSPIDTKLKLYRIKSTLETIYPCIQPKFSEIHATGVILKISHASGKGISIYIGYIRAVTVRDVYREGVQRLRVTSNILFKHIYVTHHGKSRGLSAMLIY